MADYLTSISVSELDGLFSNIAGDGRKSVLIGEPRLMHLRTLREKVPRLSNHLGDKSDFLVISARHAALWATLDDALIANSWTAKKIEVAIF